MFAVIFEVTPTIKGKDQYLKIAAELRKLLENRDGFISIERFQSLTEKGKVLSLSFWKDEASIEKWRNLIEHRSAQKSGKETLFESYRIRVAKVVRDYTESDRGKAPPDSNATLLC
jgi:heme-degrading monooxygenase HmoA